MPLVKDAGGENGDESNYGNNYICVDVILLIRLKKGRKKNGPELESDMAEISQSLLLATAVNSVINYSQL